MRGHNRCSPIQQGPKRFVLDPCSTDDTIATAQKPCRALTISFSSAGFGVSWLSPVCFKAPTHAELLVMAVTQVHTGTIAAVA